MHYHNPCFVPADVPEKKHDTFVKNYCAMTRQTGRLFLFSCDQKIEHLNDDFYGTNIHAQALHPEHLFRIASQGNIGAMTTHLGLLARYAHQYPEINYIVQLNGVSNLALQRQQNPYSALLWSLEDVINFKNNNTITIAGIGITIYIGNKYESQHLAQAAKAILQAHNEGLIAIVSICPYGKALSQEDNHNSVTADATGIALSLGADFVKIQAPKETDVTSTSASLKIASAAAGNTGVIYSDEALIEPHIYLAQLYDYIHNGDVKGTATGRNIFQRSLTHAIALTHAVAAIVYDNVDAKSSFSLFNEEIAKRSEPRSP